MLGQQSETAFGEQHGCLPVTAKLPYKWPLALDIIRRGFEAHWDKRLLGLFSNLYDGLGPNIEQTLLGNTGIVTIDPDNIEVMLSTRFEDFGFGPRRSAFYTLLGEVFSTRTDPLGNILENSYDVSLSECSPEPWRVSRTCR